MGEAARALGAGALFHHGGEVYRAAELTLEMLAGFELWLEDRAYGKVQRTRGRCPGADYQERLDSVTRLVATDTFNCFGPVAVQASRSVEGTKHLLYLQLRGGQNGHPVSEELASEIYDADPDGTVARLNGIASKNPPAPVTEASSPGSPSA